MIIIPLRAIPNQRIIFPDGNNRWMLRIHTGIDSTLCDIWLNNQVVLLGERVVAGVPVITFPYLTDVGNFGILTENDDEPNWRLFETSQQLVYWND